MKHILKNNEPTSLRIYRETPPPPTPTYSGVNKRDIQESLLNEQGHICAYCMQRISLKYNLTLSKPRIEIEHFRSQHRHLDKVLDYKNMLGVCNGNADKPSHQLICDKAKSDHDKTHDLFLDPLLEEREAQIKYTREGRIFSEVDDIEKDLEILNLNEQNLQESRGLLFVEVKREIRDFKKSVRGHRTKSIEFLEKLRTKWESKKDNKFRPLCRVPLYVIEKELQKYS